MLATLLFGARAHAQSEPESEAKPPDAAAGADGTDQLTLQKGRLVVNGFVEISLSTDAVFKPFSISPDAWYGVTDDITAGLVHSATAVSGFIGGVGDALCLAGESGGCAEVYPGVGFEARYKLKLGGFAAAAEGGLLIQHLGDPFAFALKAGGIARWHQGKIAVEVQPNLIIALSNRGSTTTGGITISGNRDFLNLPITGMYALTPMIWAALQVGVALPFEDTGDAYRLPLSIGGHYRVNDMLSVSLAFSLPALVGGGSGTGADSRSLTLGGSYAF
ncbi:MAG TPA: hypothetical protein VK601_13965 [Kofleriaceae bacterium]|nr:hypothetical protein [Kofleriaceae bacterium]